MLLSAFVWVRASTETLGIMVDAIGIVVAVADERLFRRSHTRPDGMSMARWICERNCIRICSPSLAVGLGDCVRVRSASAPSTDWHEPCEGDDQPLARG